MNFMLSYDEHDLSESSSTLLFYEGFDEAALLRSLV